MYQPNQHPDFEQHRSLGLVRCECGWTREQDEPGAAWLAASHLADHDPDDVVAVSTQQATTLSLVLARGAGWADVLAPAHAFDLGVASSLLRCSAVREAGAHVLHVQLLWAIGGVAERAAGALAGTFADEEVIDALDDAADDLYLLAVSNGAPAAAPASRAPRVRLAEVSDGARIASLLALLEQPVLSLLPPPSAARHDAGAESLDEAVVELTAIPGEIAGLKEVLSVELRALEHDPAPLVIVADATLDLLAQGVLDLRLGELRVTCLAESIVGSGDDDLVAWATLGAGRLTSHLRTLGDELSALLELFEAGS